MPLCLRGRCPEMRTSDWCRVCHGAHYGEGPVLAILAMLVRQGALRVVPGAPLLPSPALRVAAWALPGRGGKAGSPIEPESWICEVAARTTMSRSGLRVT